MEPLNLFSELPLRASQRLDAVLALGITPRAVVLFHELAAINPTLPREEAIAVPAEQLATVAGLALQRAGSALWPILTHAVAVGAAKFRRSHRTIEPVDVPAFLDPTPRVDPVLVIVTGDGYWVELDRWYN
jgi:hypothetical protein